MAEVTRWLPRIAVSACRNAVPGDARARAAAARPRVAAPSSSSASSRCSTETYSSLSRLASRSAASSSRASRWVTKTWPGAAPGPLTRGRRAELGLQLGLRARPGRRRPARAAAARARRAGRAGPAAGARRRPRCGRSAAPWSARRAAPPATSGSAGSCPRRSLRCGRGAVARAGLELGDAVEQVEHQAERGVVEGEAGAQPLDAGPTAASWAGGNHSSPAASLLGVEQAERDEPADQVGVQAGRAGRTRRGRGRRRPTDEGGASSPPPRVERRRAAPAPRTAGAPRR